MYLVTRRLHSLRCLPLVSPHPMSSLHHHQLHPRHLQVSPQYRDIDSGSGLVRPEPERTSHAGLLKMLLISSLGLYLGASISQKMAAFLEENDLFVPDDDDDD